MKIEGIAANISGVAPLEVNQGRSVSPSGQESSSFKDMYLQAIGEVNSLQKEADGQIAGLATGNPNVTTHSAMIAMEKADLAYQLMTTIKGKIIRAYEELIRTQI